MDDPVTVVALLRLRPDAAERFTEYETQACAIAARHGGRLERRVAAAARATEGRGYDEVHVWRFRDRPSFAAYRADPALAALADLRAAAIADTQVIVGRDAPAFDGKVIGNPLAALEGERVGVFHIASRTDWAAAQQSGVYRHASLEREGFIHCSTRPQALPTAQRHFDGAQGLVLLRLDAMRLADDLRYEAPDERGREHELFPHLYAPLPVDAVLGVYPLVAGDDGSFEWPEGA